MGEKRPSSPNEEITRNKRVRFEQYEQSTLDVNDASDSETVADEQVETFIPESSDSSSYIDRQVKEGLVDDGGNLMSRTFELLELAIGAVNTAVSKEELDSEEDECRATEVYHAKDSLKKSADRVEKLKAALQAEEEAYEGHRAALEKTQADQHELEKEREENLTQISKCQQLLAGFGETVKFTEDFGLIAPISCGGKVTITGGKTGASQFE